MTHTRWTEPVITCVAPKIDEGYYKSVVETNRAHRLLTFMPTGFVSTYEYPLILFLHREGNNEQQIKKLMPHLSRRNYICTGLRGTVPMYREDGRQGFGWDSQAGLSDELEEYTLAAIADCYDRLPVHADRIFLCGVGEGAAQAYRLAFSFPNKFAGVIALNGKLPKNGPLWRLSQTRKIPVFMGHGEENQQISHAQAKQDHKLLYTAGMDVNFNSYQTTEKLQPAMFRDMDRWIMKIITNDGC
jgi:phospholipase/carboxylesterase